MTRAIKSAADVLAAFLSLLAIYTAGFGVFDNAWLSGLTVALGMSIVLLRTGAGDWRLTALHIVLGLVFIWLSWIWLDIMLEQEEFFVDIDRHRLMLAWIAFALIGYVTWRSFGLPIMLVCLACAAYAVFGAGEAWTRVGENLWYSTDGVYGRPVEVVGRVVLVFIAFGAVLQTSGAGAVLLKIAFAATSRLAGGPAHASIVGSALFGTMSGAAVANVASTGIFTIPIIKRAGFSARFAGGVESAASTGGQIMPPVMGVAAFLMADVTDIAYLKVIAAAVIPAMMYYASLFMVVSVEARRLGITATPADERETITAKDWIRSLAFFVPLIVIVWLLANGRTAQYAGFCALIAAMVMCLVLFPAFRHPSRWLQALIDGGRTAATLMVIVAAIGFVIGVINMTGIGLKFAQAILAVSGSSIFLSLLLVMVGCLVMGMGVPSAPAYLIVAIVMGPALEQLGIPTIGAHLFMLYFGVLSVVTPPVALAAFAAAPIAGSKPMETGITALRLSVAGFIIPFLFIARPDILLIEGFTTLGLIWAIVVFAASTWMIATALGRHQSAAIPLWQAGLRFFVGLIAIHPRLDISVLGVVLAVVLTRIHKTNDRSKD